MTGWNSAFPGLELSSHALTPTPHLCSSQRPKTLFFFLSEVQELSEPLCCCATPCSAMAGSRTAGARLSQVPPRGKAASDDNMDKGTRCVANAFGINETQESQLSGGGGKQGAHTVFVLGSVATPALDTESTQTLPVPGFPHRLGRFSLGLSARTSFLHFHVTCLVFQLFSRHRHMWPKEFFAIYSCEIIFGPTGM